MALEFIGNVLLGAQKVKQDILARKRQEALEQFKMEMERKKYEYDEEDRKFDRSYKKDAMEGAKIDRELREREIARLEKGSKYVEQEEARNQEMHEAKIKEINNAIKISQGKLERSINEDEKNFETRIERLKKLKADTKGKELSNEIKELEIKEKEDILNATGISKKAILNFAKKNGISVGTEEETLAFLTSSGSQKALALIKGIGKEISSTLRKKNIKNILVTEAGIDETLAEAYSSSEDLGPMQLNELLSRFIDAKRAARIVAKLNEDATNGYGASDFLELNDITYEDFNTIEGRKGLEQKIDAFKLLREAVSENPKEEVNIEESFIKAKQSGGKDLGIQSISEPSTKDVAASVFKTSQILNKAANFFKERGVNNPEFNSLEELRAMVSETSDGWLSKKTSKGELIVDIDEELAGRAASDSIYKNMGVVSEKEKEIIQQFRATHFPEMVRETHSEKVIKKILPSHADTIKTLFRR